MSAGRPERRFISTVTRELSGRTMPKAEGSTLMHRQPPAGAVALSASDTMRRCATLAAEANDCDGADRCLGRRFPKPS